VAWVFLELLKNPDGFFVEDGGVVWCNPDNASGTDEDRKWVAENVDMWHGPTDPLGELEDTYQVRNEFFSAWREFKESSKGYLWADCTWPVEARFLIDCVEDERPGFGQPQLKLEASPRNWLGPYPLMDLAPLLFQAGLNPLDSFKRLEDEEPAHHPLADARQSARILGELLTGCVPKKTE